MPIGRWSNPIARMSGHDNELLRDWEQQDVQDGSVQSWYFIKKFAYRSKPFSNGSVLKLRVQGI